MLRHLILGISLLFIVGCDKAPNNKIEGTRIKPIWKQNLIIGTSDKIWNNGLLTPIVYGDKIVIFNTTLHHSSNSEDNRLCGLDISNGSIEWLFPSDQNSKYNYLFDGSAYLYQNTLLTRSVSSDTRMENDVLAIELTVPRLEFKENLPFNDWYRNCYGESKYLAWEENTEKISSIYLMNIETQQTNKIISNQNNLGYDVVFSIINIHDGVITYLEQGFRDKTYGKFICLYDVRANKLINRYQINIEADGYLLHGGCYNNNKLYLLIREYILAVDITNGNEHWRVNINEHLNYHPNSILIAGDNIFLGGENMYALMDKTTGQILYKKKVSGCKWFTQYNGYIYINQMNRISIVDPKSGEIVAYIEAENEIFNIGNIASFYNDKMYVMSYTSAYCYPTYPWK